MVAAAPGFDCRNFIYHLGACHDLAKHRIAPALGRDGRVIEKAVVSHIDEKLSRG